MFRALVLQENQSRVTTSIEELSETQLPDGDVDIAVEYSSLNYKDGMILKGLGRLVHQYPHVPGVDLAGTVMESRSRLFHPGDRVVLTGWHVGERHWGGYAQKARVKSEWLLPLPENLTTKQSMAIGTAGIAAMLAVMSLEEHGLTPGKGEVLVTGATGGVGSIAVLLLAARGYSVVAVTGRPALHGYLKSLGATAILDRQKFSQPPPKLLESERWVGCVDAVGGTMLARAGADALRQFGRCGGVGRRQQARNHRAAFPAARREPPRHRLDAMSRRAPQAGVEPACKRAAVGKTRRTHHRCPARGASASRGRNSSGTRPRARRGGRQRLTAISARAACARCG